MEGDCPEDADRLKGELRRLNEQFEAAERGGESSGGGAMDSPRATMPGAPVDLHVNEGFKIRRLTIDDGPENPVVGASAPMLSPEPRRVLTYQLAAPPQSDATVAELRKQVEQLRHELSELRNQAEKAKK
jgi:hypothetical protein